MQSLAYYTNLLGDGGFEIQADIGTDQAAVLIKAHDYGVACLSEGEIQLLDQLISRLKDSLKKIPAVAES